MKNLNFNLKYLIHNVFNFLKFKNIYKYINSYKYFVIFIIIVILIIRILFCLYLFNYKYNNEEYNKEITLLILSKEKITETNISYLVRIKEKNNFTDKFILNIYIDKDVITDVDKELYLKNYGNFKYGNIIKIKGKIVIPKKLNNQYEFDYKRYLNSKNIVGTIMTFDATINSNLKDNILTYIFKFKESLEYMLDSKLPVRESNLFKSMIYGDDTNLDKDIRENFTKLGLSHLLSVSGNNLGIVLLLLSIIFKKIKVNSFILFIINVLFIFIFSAISEFEISVIRASIISVIVLLASIKSIKLNKFFSITVALVIIIINNPCSVFNISFILSFTAFMGIILFSKLINSLFNVYITKLIGLSNVIKIKNNKSKIHLIIFYKFLKFISNILSLYFSVQIFIMPIQIYFFNSFTVISILSNLIIYIFSTLQLILGYLFISLIHVPYISDILSNLNYLILWVILKIVNILIGFNILEIKLPTPNYLTILCYYILVIFIFYSYKINFYLKYKSKNINTKLMLKVIAILCVIYIIYFNIYTTYFFSFVYYFNVEQGSMSLIKSGNKVILVDMGTTGKVNLENILENFLNAYNIHKIDFFIVTHLHSDHISGLFRLEEKLKNNKIKIESIIYSIPKNEDSFVINNFTENCISYLEFENFLNRFKIKQVIVERYDKIIVDKNITIDILSPKDKEIISSKDKVNASSIITLISIRKLNYLFMGDSTIESEKVMLDDIFNLENKDVYLNKLKNLQVIQIGHHGSNTSTSDYLLKNINTKLAIISCKKSVYGHPSSTVLSILKKYNIRVHITENKGGMLYF
jgi:competence protein ComEC